jgi:hypothetical protein
MTDDFYKSEPKMMLQYGNTIVKTNEYMYIAAAH